MADLVALEDAKAHIRVTGSADDQDCELKLAQATEIVIDYVNQRRVDDGSPSWADTVAGWTDETVPVQVQAAILKQFACLWRFRGDDEARPPLDENGLAPGVAGLLARLRDPGLA